MNEDVEFIKSLDEIIDINLGKESFGVAELSEAMNMSRSNLLRKVKKATNMSVTQRISTARLEKAMVLLRNSALNVSEVSYEVGFSSPSYFIKCFREFYGYPPGEVGNLLTEVETPKKGVARKKKFKPLMYGFIAIIVFSIMIWFFKNNFKEQKEAPEKSIIVLPFKNDSADSSNTYIINGLMDAIRGNLETIKDLKVLSRTSSEKYRNVNKTIPEMAGELDVNYFVEGSGQKLGNRLVLNIQLIDGLSDRKLWGKQYRREAKDIFGLQQDIAKDIAEGIQAVITPEEKSRIEKVYTTDLIAYDDFLKGIDLLKKGGDFNILQSLEYFKKAYTKDTHFALAYACAGMAHFYLDLYKSDKTRIDSLAFLADRAMLLDSKLPESYTAKAMYYILKKDFKQVEPFLEKGLTFNPNSFQLNALMADLYGTYLPNTAKYIKYALKGLRLGMVSADSIELSYQYLRLGNALIQTGFVDESLLCLEKSLSYKADNPYSNYVKAFAIYAKTKNLEQAKNILEVEFQKDSSRFDILQDIAKIAYYQRNYDEAYHLYTQFNQYRLDHHLDVYQHENMLIGVTFQLAGHPEESQYFMDSYRKYLDTDQTQYKNLGFAMYHAYLRETKIALENFKLFSKEDNIQHWIILFLPQDPIIESIKNNSEFKKTFKVIEQKFWAKKELIKNQLEEEGLLKLIL